MTAMAALYNTLPSLGEAEERFVDRDAVFAAVSNLLAPYGSKFGLCLIHSHSTLYDGEIMLAQGDVSQPVLMSDTPSTSIYPDRWLPTGEAYEFTTQPTEAPPKELMAEFGRLTGSISVLGLYYAGTADHSIQLEWTDGRKKLSMMPSTDPPTSPKQPGHSAKVIHHSSPWRALLFVTHETCALEAASIREPRATWRQRKGDGITLNEPILFE